MIPITIDGQQFALSFSHSKFDHTKVKRIINNEFVEVVPRRRRDTECRIIRVTEASPSPDAYGYTVVATGKSSCSPEDNFSKSTGRENALLDAIRRAKKSSDPMFNVHDAASAEHFHAVEDQIWGQYDNRASVRRHYKEIAA